MPDVEVTRRTLRFVASAETEIDLYALRDGLACDDPQITAQVLTLYRGELLHGLYLEDAPYFSEWLIPERERLRQRVFNASHQLCQHFLEQQLWQDGIDVAQRWLTHDTLNEEAHRWLIRLFASSGQLAAAPATI